MKKIVIAYIPVLHEGYRRFFEKHAGDSILYVLGDSITKEYVPIKKDLRQLDPNLMVKAVSTLGFFREVKVLEAYDLCNMDMKKLNAVMPDDVIMHDIHEKFFSETVVDFDTIFLRWDKHKSSDGQKVEVDQEITREEFDRDVMRRLYNNSQKKSSDWWRRVGAAIIENEKVIAESWNKHVPSEHMPYVNGDPRADFHKGDHVELSTAVHAEAFLIADSAKHGRKMEGLSMYVTNFPCPTCAKLIAFSGISKLYYGGGYGVLDGESVLRNQGVKIIYVDNSL